MDKKGKNKNKKQEEMQNLIDNSNCSSSNHEQVWNSQILDNEWTKLMLDCWNFDIPAIEEHVKVYGVCIVRDYSAVIVAGARYFPRFKPKFDRILLTLGFKPDHLRFHVFVYKFNHIKKGGRLLKRTYPNTQRDIVSKASFF